MHRVIMLLAAVSACLTDGALGQAAPALDPGARVRITAHPFGLRRAPVTLSAATDDTLYISVVSKRLEHGSVVTDSRQHAVPVESISRLEVPAGRRSNWDKGAKTGALIGGAAGLLAGAAFAACDDWGCPDGPGQKIGAAVGGTMAGALMGGIVGALIGAMSTRDAWADVSADRVRIAIRPRMLGMGVVASVPF